MANEREDQYLDNSLYLRNCCEIQLVEFKVVFQWYSVESPEGTLIPGLQLCPGTSWPWTNKNHCSSLLCLFLFAYAIMPAPCLRYIKVAIWHNYKFLKLLFLLISQLLYNQKLLCMV